MRLIISSLAAAALLAGFAASAGVSAQEGKKYRNYDDRYDDGTTGSGGTTAPSVASSRVTVRETPTTSGLVPRSGGEPWTWKGAAVTAVSRRFF